jgi:phosphoribosylglycinamide formyltransferase-1
VLLASGSGTLAQAIMDAVRDDDLRIDLVALVSDRESPALKRAEEATIANHLIPFRPERKLWSQELHACVAKLAPDLVVSVGFMRILDAQFVRDFPTINTHPSLLPHFPGAHAVRDALKADVAKTGCTVHWVDEGIDTGKVILQQEIEILTGDSEDELHERIKQIERLLIVRVLRDFSDNY